MTDRMDAGAAAEDAALKYLEAAGLRLLLRNYRCKAGELDLVMLEDQTLVLIEVRYRKHSRFGGAAASVDVHKQRRFINAARHLLLSKAELRRYPARFDVVAIDRQRADISVEWLKGAFVLQ